MAPLTELDSIEAALGALGRRDVPIGPLTTYRAGGAARVFCALEAESDLDVVRKALSGTTAPILVIGKGSNLLVSDAGFAGVCLQLGEAFSSVELHGRRVRAGGGAAYPVVARR